MRRSIRGLWRSVSLASIACVALGATAVALATAPASPARADVGISQLFGVDSCALMNNANAAQKFWTDTPYTNFGLYIGGVDARCPVNGASFVTTLRNIGWQLMLIWVGPQSSCLTGQTSPAYISNSTSTAYTQGTNEAGAAYNKLLGLGIGAQDTPITYDLEPWDTGNSTCASAARSFIQGWVDELHVGIAQKAGVYGSTCASGLSLFASITTPPDYIVGAQWDGNRKTSVMSCVPANDWANHQRHKQYNGDINRTYNGLTLSVDEDCSNGPVYPGPNMFSTTTGCV
jgi:hypothetical protein